MVYQFLLYNKVNQLYIYIYPHITSLLRLPPSLPPFLPIPPLQVVTKHRADLPVLAAGRRIPNHCTTREAPTGYFFFLFFLFFKYLFIFGCVGSSVRVGFLCEGFLQLRRAGATLHHGARASHCRGLSLRSTGSRRAGSAAVAHGPSCSAACGIFPDQGSNPCPLHWQADSQPLCHQGSPLAIS